MNQDHVGTKMLVCVACGCPIETNPGYPDIWRCPIHGDIAEAKLVEPPQETAEQLGETT